MKRLIALFALCAATSAAAPLRLSLGTNGDVSFLGSGAKLGFVVFKEGWSGSMSCQPRQLANGRTGFFLSGDDGVRCIEGSVTLDVAVDGETVAFSLCATCFSGFRMECAAVELSLPSDVMTGMEWRFGDGSHGLFPEQPGKTSIQRGVIDSFAFQDPHSGEIVELRFPRPMRTLVQDSRNWGPKFTVRFEIPVPKTIPAGTEIAFDCTIARHGGILVEHDEIVTITPGPDWIPLENRKNIVEGSALDFSGMGWTDAPAGKFGWLRAVGGHFEFEGLPEEERRFYGVNLCETANFPGHALADELVARLKRLGYNSIRFHHHDEKWKNALAARAGRKGVDDAASGRVADDDIDKFDFFVAKAIENGLYITTDLYVSRQVAWRDIGFDRDGFVPNNVFKSLVALHEPAFENWASFARDFLLHENPYTGRRYIDEPGMPFLCLVNEGPMKWAWNDIKTMDCTRDAWRDWKCRSGDASHAESRTGSPHSGIPDDPSAIGSFLESAAAQRFAAFVERAAFEREKEFLRSLGCKALLTSQNCADDRAMASMRSTYDYADNHFYHGNPQFLGANWKSAFRFDGGNPAKAEGLSTVNAAFTRIVGKPYTITEWNFAGPSLHRAAGGFLVGAMSARQAWAGLWRFAYSHVEQSLADGYGAPHLFDLAVDPVNLASERAAMCLFLRGDMAPLKTKVALDVGSPRIPADGRPPVNRPEWMDAAWRLRVGRTTGSPREDGWSVFPLDAVLATPPVAPEDRPDFTLDRETGSILVATPRTCGVFAEGGVHEVGALRVEILARRHDENECNPSAVWASSLDGEPLETSSRILVTHLTDAQAEGNVFAGRARDTLLRWGKGRTLVRNGAVSVSLVLDAPESCEVWGLATDGTRMELVPAIVKNGRLSFTADVDSGCGARMFYEIERKSR